MKTFKLFILLFLFVLSFYGCAQNEGTNSLTVSELKEKIKNNDSTIVILDVRTGAELAGTLPKIEGALHIPVQELGKRFEELEKYKDKETVTARRQRFYVFITRAQ